MTTALAFVGLVLAMIPAAMYVKNVPLFRVLRKDDLSKASEENASALSILVPARNEESSIEACVRCALDSHDGPLEVVVLDDDSDDRTSEIVFEISQQDSRVRCVQSKPLPEGWNGKQYACYQLSTEAQYDNLAFIDADVRLSSGAMSLLLERRCEHGIGLLSAFPRQETGTWLEKWIIPMMHSILLGYLPFDRMRASLDESFAAGCGQLFVTSQSDYQTAGTHRAIQASRHDGVKLPRAYRRVGLSTDVIDGTDLAVCRMYNNAGEVVRGVLKNATEGIANPKLIGVFTVLLLGAVVLPWGALVMAGVEGNSLAAVIAMIAIVLGHLPRGLAVKQLRQPVLGVVCHVPATMLFVFLQWVALISSLIGKQVQWRGRD